MKKGGKERSALSSRGNERDGKEVRSGGGREGTTRTSFDSSDKTVKAIRQPAPSTPDWLLLQ